MLCPVPNQPQLGFAPFLHSVVCLEEDYSSAVPHLPFPVVVFPREPQITEDGTAVKLGCSTGRLQSLSAVIVRNNVARGDDVQLQMQEETVAGDSKERNSMLIVDGPSSRGMHSFFLLDLYLWDKDAADILRTQSKQVGRF